MTEQVASDQVGTGQDEADRSSDTEAPDRAGSTTPERGSEDVAPARDTAQTETAESGDVAQSAQESRAAEAVREGDQQPGESKSSDSADVAAPSAQPNNYSQASESTETEDDTQRSDEERQRAAEGFAREHDPEQHDVSAGEEFRQPGDWTADDAGGAQVWDSEGNLVEGSAPGATTTTNDQSSQSHQSNQSDQSAGTDRRTSELDEVRDGGYGVGSAAPLDDGALPLGHPVKAWEDTKTFVTPDHEKYDEADPHVWFTDADAAQQAGFRPID